MRYTYAIYEGQPGDAGKPAHVLDAPELLPFIVEGAKLRIVKTHYHAVRAIDESFELYLSGHETLRSVDKVVVHVYCEKVADSTGLLRPVF